MNDLFPSTLISTPQYGGSLFPHAVLPRRLVRARLVLKRQEAPQSPVALNSNTAATHAYPGTENPAQANVDGLSPTDLLEFFKMHGGMWHHRQPPTCSQTQRSHIVN